MLQKWSIIIVLILITGCGTNFKQAPSSIELFYQDIQKADRAELFNIVGDSVGYSEGYNLKELITLLLNSKPGPYPEGNTGGEVEGMITLYFEDKTINLTLATNYLAVNDPEPKRYSLTEPHLILNGVSSNEIRELF